MTPRVLVVDDDDDIRVLLAELLRLSGFVPAMAGNGREAIEYLRTCPPAERPVLVLLDVQMPDLDGWETLRRIRQEVRVDTPVILCTVKASDADLDRGWALGCDGYVAKPFAIEDLVREIHAVIDRPPDARQHHRDAARRALAARA